MKSTHLNEDGVVYMVDVTTRNPTVRQASAVYRVGHSSETMQALCNGTVPKDDILAVVRMAGISTAKCVPELLSLVYTIGVHGCAVDLSLEDDCVAICMTARTADHTGVEMEALTLVMVATLAIVDIVEGMDRSAHIREAKIVVRSGGRSDDWVRSKDPQT